MLPCKVQDSVATQLLSVYTRVLCREYFANTLVPLITSMCEESASLEVRLAGQEAESGTSIGDDKYTFYRSTHPSAAWIKQRPIRSRSFVQHSHSSLRYAATKFCLPVLLLSIMPPDPDCRL